MLRLAPVSLWPLTRLDARERSATQVAIGAVQVQLRAQVVIAACASLMVADDARLGGEGFDGS